jgi:hypothetical protein
VNLTELVIKTQSPCKLLRYSLNGISGAATPIFLQVTEVALLMMYNTMEIS